MKRSILFSVVVIGAVVSLVASAATFAAFTGSGSASGSITAATVDLEVGHDGTADGTLVFSGAGITCDEDILPGDTCSSDVYVKNTSTDSVEIDVAAGDVVLSGFGGCWTESSSITGATNIASGASASVGTVGVTLVDDDACQGVNPTLVVTVTGTAHHP